MLMQAIKLESYLFWIDSKFSFEEMELQYYLWTFFRLETSWGDDFFELAINDILGFLDKI